MTVFRETDFPPLPPQRTRRRQQRSIDIAANISSPRPLGTAATIDDLPDELILEILEYLSGIDIEHFQLPTLVSLSLTSCRFHRIVAAELYAIYSSHFCEPYLFLRTVMTKPQLAKLVKHVEVSYGSWGHRNYKRYDATAQDKKTIKEGLRMLSISNWKSWTADCNAVDGATEALHSAILMYTPDIISLVIEDAGSYGQQGPRWIDLIRKATTDISSMHTHRFEKLRSIRVGAGHYTINQLAPLFRLASLRQLCLNELVAFDIGGGAGPQALQRVVPQCCNNIEELQLEQSFLNMEILGVLVASPRKLRILKLDITLECISHELNAHHELGAMKLSRVLRPQKDSLQSFYLNCDARAEEETRGAINLHGGLRNFIALEHMSCPLTSVIETRIGASATLIESLPPSLLTYQTVVRKFTNDRNCLIALEHMAANCHTYAPHVKNIYIGVPSPAPWFTYEWEPLVKSFSKTGVNFVVEEAQDDDDFSEVWGVDSTDSSRSSDEVDLYSDAD
ncbi:Nn.00g010630.m01.CDS01 [Neocucurbitaria sp. VM-36]